MSAARSGKMAEPRTPLDAEIRRLIGVAGPMPIAEYMQLCLTHPQHGYYINRDPLGSGGDFVTSPEISQMFGELIGLWMARGLAADGRAGKRSHHRARPRTRHSDARRAARREDRRGLSRRAWSCISSRSVRRCSRCSSARSKSLDAALLWHAATRRGAARPEHHRRQRIRRCAAGASGGQASQRLARARHRRSRPTAASSLLRRPSLCRISRRQLPRGLRKAPEGAIFEWRADSLALELGRRLRDEGAALIIDYGHAQFGLGDTLQAVAGHSFTDPLRAPGNADLTAHVDFEAVAQCARKHGRAHSRASPAARSVSAARHRAARDGA